MRPRPSIYLSREKTIVKQKVVINERDIYTQSDIDGAMNERNWLPPAPAHTGPGAWPVPG